MVPKLDLGFADGALDLISCDRAYEQFIGINLFENWLVRVGVVGEDNHLVLLN